MRREKRDSGIRLNRRIETECQTDVVLDTLSQLQGLRLMPETMRVIPIVATLDAEKSRGNIRIEEIPEQERMRGAIKIGSLFLSLAIFSVLLPVLHFFLVPGFLIFSGVAAYKKYNTKERIVSEEIHCPHCSTPLDLSGIKPGALPVDVDCKNCFNKIRVQQESAG